MWMTIGILILACNSAVGKLTGDNICQEEKRYTINVTEYFVRNSTIRRYEWCLNVPPRCSFYTTRLINDSRVVEKEIADLIDTCCSGYVESEDGTFCIPVCPDCANGKCVQGKCQCFPGYKGHLCDTECEASEWGENCRFRCACNNGGCDSKTGSCICRPGWTGNLCESPCPENFFGTNCLQQCPCQPYELCHHVTGECETITTSSTTTTYKTTPSTSIFTKPTKHKAKIDKSAIVSFKNNGKFDKAISVSTSTALEVTETEFAKVRITSPTTKVNEVTPTREVAVSTVGSGTAREENYLLTNKVGVSTVGSSTGEENYLLKEEVQMGGVDRPINKNELVNSASAATAISAAVIIIAVIILAANHFIRHKRKMEEEKERSKGVPTVSVYTHSIFHTPLPEPPTFENPIFVTPLEPEGQRFETRVVCSMNFPTLPSKDPREYLYDHPPSTGSYRAASIPEPPDIDGNNYSVQCVPHAEPLYDEIPSGMIPAPVTPPPPSYKSSTLYMNTCGKTRL